MPSPKSILCTIAVTLVILGKGWLIAGSSIVDAGDDPHEYVNQILHPANEGIAYGPGTGLIGRLFYDIGLPFRWGIEAAFVLAVILVLRALLDWPTRNYLAASLFLFLLFDPAPTELFSHLMSDQIWLVETMIGFSLFVLAVENEAKPRWWLLGLGALSLGLSTITRSTFVPLMLDLFGFVLAASLLLPSKRTSRPASPAVLFLSLWTLLLGIGLIYGGTCWYNARSYGYSGISALDSTEYKNFYLSLQSVGTPTGAPYFPIDENHRELIATAGPTSRWFIGQIETKTAYKEAGVRYYGISDFPTGWFHFAAFNVLFNASHGNLRQSFDLMKTIEGEISGAGRRGAVPVRAILPLPDSRPAIVLTQLPRALGHTLRQIAYEPPPDWLKESSEHGATSNPDFTRALHRQNVHATPAQEEIESLLVRFYSFIYLPLTVIFLFVFFAALIGYRHYPPSLSLAFLSRQLFILTFFVMAFWYALFDASGLPVLSRYMIYHHVLLPVLIAFCLIEIRRIAREDSPRRLRPPATSSILGGDGRFSTSRGGQTR